MINITKTIRFTAWLLLPLIILYFFTGVDMTRGIFKPALSHRIHTDFLPLPVFLIVLFHSALGAKSMLTRYKKTNKITDAIIALISFALLGMFIYAVYFL